MPGRSSPPDLRALCSGLRRDLCHLLLKTGVFQLFRYISCRILFLFGLDRCADLSVRTGVLLGWFLRAVFPAAAGVGLWCLGCCSVGFLFQTLDLFLRLVNVLPRR